MVVYPKHKTKERGFMESKIKQFSVGDILLMKKPHACAPSADKFEVLRLGSDIKIRCCNCRHEVSVARIKLEKNIKRVISES